MLTITIKYYKYSPPGLGNNNIEFYQNRMKEICLIILGQINKARQSP